MRLLVQSAMIFFGTLMVAGLLALGERRASPSLATWGGGEPGRSLVLQGAGPDASVASSGR